MDPRLIWAASDMEAFSRCSTDRVINANIKISYAIFSRAPSANDVSDRASLSFYEGIPAGERARAVWPGSKMFACKGKLKVQDIEKAVNVGVVFVTRLHRLQKC
ncbi:hypothetical protein EDB19DRAFT_1834654 [Suillus lakei]|nr:hypothetical protein EDB19DRAFT_1834654 [Suillus lakei]